MICVKSKYIHEESIKKSRFIGVIQPCCDESDIMNILKQLISEYPDASHIAYAYRIKGDKGLIYRFHDAGEPTGTAGKPIFQHLDGKNLVNTLIVVIRYFGGVKLGAGGLTRAYGNAARQVIEVAETHPYIERVNTRLTLDYRQMQALEYLLNKLDGNILEKVFAEQVHLHIQLPSANLHTLLESMDGQF